MKKKNCSEVLISIDHSRRSERKTLAEYLINSDEDWLQYSGNHIIIYILNISE